MELGARNGTGQDVRCWAGRGARSRTWRQPSKSSIELQAIRERRESRVAWRVANGGWCAACGVRRVACGRAGVRRVCREPGGHRGDWEARGRRGAGQSTCTSLSASGQRENGESIRKAVSNCRRSERGLSRSWHGVWRMAGGVQRAACGVLGAVSGMVYREVGVHGVIGKHSVANVPQVGGNMHERLESRPAA